MKGAALILLVLASAAHAETRPHYGGTVDGALLGAPTSLDPVAAQSHAEATVVGLVFDTLFQLGPDGIAAPHLAAALPAIDGTAPPSGGAAGRGQAPTGGEHRLVVRIAIRRGVRFQDGAELTAGDVVASLMRVKSSGARWALAAVSSIRADGDLVELTLRAPVPRLTALLALPQTAITRGGKPPGEHPIGSGPFLIESLDRSKHELVLRAFDGHFAGRPYLDQLRLHWFDTPDGEARRFETGTSQLSARGVTPFAGAAPVFRADDIEGPSALLVFVGFGRAHAAITGDHAFRRAVDRALARGGLSAIGSGERVTPTREPLPVEAGGAALDAAGLGDDLTAARAALAEAARHTAQLAPDQLGALSLDILVEDTRPDDREIAERVLRALDKLGIAATITAVPAQTLRERVANGTCDLWIGQLAAPVGVPEAWWGAAFAVGGDDWAHIKLAAGKLDGAAATIAFDERLPIIPLLIRTIRLWHRSDVRGAAFDASGRPCFADLFLFGEPARARPGPHPP